MEVSVSVRACIKFTINHKKVSKEASFVCLSLLETESIERGEEKWFQKCSYMSLNVPTKCFILKKSFKETGRNLFGTFFLNFTKKI